MMYFHVLFLLTALIIGLLRLKFVHFKKLIIVSYGLYLLLTCLLFSESLSNDMISWPEILIMTLLGYISFLFLGLALSRKNIFVTIGALFVLLPIMWTLYDNDNHIKNWIENNISLRLKKKQIRKYNTASEHNEIRGYYNKFKESTDTNFVFMGYNTAGDGFKLFSISLYFRLSEENPILIARTKHYLKNPFIRNNDSITQEQVIVIDTIPISSRLKDITICFDSLSSIIKKFSEPYQYCVGCSNYMFYFKSRDDSVACILETYDTSNTIYKTLDRFFSDSELLKMTKPKLIEYYNLEK